MVVACRACGYAPRVFSYMHLAHTTVRRPTTRSNDVEKFLTTEEVAALARVQPGTVRVWRVHKTGPKGIRRGRRVLYPESAVLAWLRGEDEQTAAANA